MAYTYNGKNDKSAAEALQESQERYRVLVSNLPIGVYQCTPGPEGQFLMANPAFVKMLGFASEAELKRIRVCDIYVNARERKKVSESIILRGGVTGTEISLKKKDGTIILCSDTAKVVYDDQGQVAYYDCIIEDITQRKRAEEALQKSEERYRGILYAIEEAYYEVDLKGYITFCNDSSYRINGYTREEFMGMHYRRLYANPRIVYSAFNRVFQTGTPNHGFSLEMIRKDGSTFYGELSISLIKNKDGKIVGFRGVGRDITEKKKFEDKLTYLSLHDQLTGLYNRAYFEEELQRLEGGRNYPVTIISIDVDGLKIINDTMGHKQGDDLLKACALILKEPLRSSDVLARVGGDEFVIVLPDTDKDNAEKIIARIREAVGAYNQSRPQLPLAISIGAATTQNPLEPLEETFKRSDDLMYHSKHGKISTVQKELLDALLEVMEENPERARRIAQALPGLCSRV